MTFRIWKPSHTPRELARISAIVAVLMCGTCDLLAQVDAGAILGTVKDSSGRIIPGAKVTVINDETGVVVTGTTNSTGEYTFAPIKIGIYSLTAEFTGFQRVAHTHVTVQVQQRVSHPRPVLVGTPPYSVRMDSPSPCADPKPIKTDRAERSESLTGRI